jgi:hypothetical protein
MPLGRRSTTFAVLDLIPHDGRRKGATMLTRENHATIGQAAVDLVLALCGLVTSLATAGLLKVIADLTGFSLYTLSLWAIIPVGAVLSGAVAASGYLLGARLLNRAPSRLLLLNVVLASVATFLTIHYFNYASLVVNGERIAAHIPFSTYLNAAIRSTSVAFGVGSFAVTPSLGVVGYFFAVLQVLGFAIGGFVAYGYLVAQPYCQRCSRYLGEKSVSLRYTADITELKRSASTVAGHVRAGAFEAALAEQQALGIEDEGTGGNYRTRIESRRCGGCGTRWMQYSIATLGEKGWGEVPDSTVANRSEEQSSRPGAGRSEVAPPVNH